MKKLLKAFAAAAAIISIALPITASAVTVDTTYDVVRINNNFNTNTATDSPDGTGYTTTTADTTFWSIGSYGSSDILLSMDFRFDDSAATMRFTNSRNKTGPYFSLNGSTFRTQTGGSSYQTIYSNFTAGNWYKMELEGKFVVATAKIVCRLYEYDADGNATLVATVDGLNLRNFYAGSSNGDCQYMTVSSGVSIDNEYAVSIYPNTVTVTSDTATIDAGSTLSLSATASRDGSATIEPSYTWAVYNEAGTALLNDANISISSTGLLNVGADSASQVITVRATAATNGAPYGDYKVTINAIDTSNDIFDEIAITPDSSVVSVGNPVTFTYTTKLDGEEVTVEDSDVYWYVYNADNLRELGNKYIAVENGVLTVTDKVIAQNIIVRAENESGSAKGTAAIYVKSSDCLENGDEGTGDLLAAANACEVEDSYATLKEGSWDGSGYYDVVTELDFAGFSSNNSDDVLYMADIKFNQTGSGWTIYNANKGKLGMQLTYTSAGLVGVVQDSARTSTYFAADADVWYHFEILCRTGCDTAYAYLIAYKYDENGNRVNPTDESLTTPYVSEIPMRNLGASQANHMAIVAGTSCDNVRALKASPDAIEVETDITTVLAGKTVQGSIVAYHDGVIMPNVPASLVTWAVYDENNKYPIDSDYFTVDANGLLEVNALAPVQRVYLRATVTGGELFDFIAIDVKSNNVFIVDAIAFNSDYTEIKQLDVTKSYYYDDDNSTVSFVIAVYDEEGALAATAVRNMYGDALVIGANTISIELDLPEDFSFDTHTIKAFTFTSL